MAPDGERVVNSVDASRRDFLRKIIAGAAFAPPLIASFNLDGLSLTDAEAQIGNQCLFSNQTIGPFFFDFSGERVPRQLPGRPAWRRHQPGHRTAQLASGAEVHGP